MGAWDGPFALHVSATLGVTVLGCAVRWWEAGHGWEAWFVMHHWGRWWPQLHRPLIRRKPKTLWEPDPCGGPQPL